MKLEIGPRLVAWLLIHIYRFCHTFYAFWLTIYMVAFSTYVSHYVGMLVSTYDALVVLFWYVSWRYNTYLESLQ